MKISKNKKGVFGIIFFFIILITILAIGFAGAIFVGVVGMASDEITPIALELGVVGDTNLSEVAQYTATPVNIVVQSLPWLIALGYVLALVFSVVLVASYNYNPNPAFIGLYFALIIMLVFFAIILSNAYQDIYEGTDEVAQRLQSQFILSHMILYAPLIYTLIAFIAGIFLFSTSGDDGGGFGV